MAAVLVLIKVARLSCSKSSTFGETLISGKLIDLGKLIDFGRQDWKDLGVEDAHAKVITRVRTSASMVRTLTILKWTYSVHKWTYCSVGGVTRVRTVTSVVCTSASTVQLSFPLLSGG